MEYPCGNAAATGFPGGGIPLGKRHAEKPIDELLETHVQVGRLTFVKPGRNIRFYCKRGSHATYDIKFDALMQRNRPLEFHDFSPALAPHMVALCTQ